MPKKRGIRLQGGNDRGQFAKISRKGGSAPSPYGEHGRAGNSDGSFGRPQSDAGRGLAERCALLGEYTYVKRTRTASSRIDAAPVGKTRIGRLVFKPAPAPANDTSDPRVTLVALVDELAALAAELYVAGRLGADPERKN